MSEYEYDLVVVGAGPAGSSAAYMAAKNGISVALLEKEENVAQTVRTSGVTWIDYAKEFGIPEDCYNPIIPTKNYFRQTRIFFANSSNSSSFKIFLFVHSVPVELYLGIM